MKEILRIVTSDDKVSFKEIYMLRLYCNYKRAGHHIKAWIAYRIREYYRKKELE